MKYLTMLLLAATVAYGQYFYEPQAGKADAAYEKAMQALDERRWEVAAKAMAEIAAKKGDKSDGALYWKAYSEAKLKNLDSALSSLKALQKDYAKSKWLNDAKALEFELQQAAGGKVSPETTGDDDLKLMALNSLMHTDPERALPVLEKVLQGTGAPKLKERALFVLAQSKTPKAREIMASIAKGQANPDLQKRAIRNLAIHGDADGRKLMAEVYASGAAADVKREVIRAYLISGDKATLASLAKSEKTPELRIEAIKTLGVMGDQQTLVDMYATETDVNVKKTILGGLFVAGAVDKLTEVARTEKDPALQVDAIRKLGVTGKGTETLLNFYRSGADPAVRKAALDGLFVSGKAKEIVELARAEKDPAMKRELVQKLSIMRSKESTEFMLELLNK